MKMKSRFNPVLQWKRRNAAKELRIVVQTYIGFSDSFLEAMQTLYKDRWGEFSDRIVNGEKPSVVAEEIAYEFIVWCLEISLRDDEKSKAAMRETIENSKLKERPPLCHTIDSYIVSVITDRIGLTESVMRLPSDPEISEDLRLHVENTLRNLSDCVTKELYEYSETNRAKVFRYFNYTVKVWRANVFKASMDFSKTDKGEIARMKYKGLLSGVIDAEDLEKIEQDLKEDN